MSEAADERAGLTVLEMLDLIERRIVEMRSLPARAKPTPRKRLILVKKAKPQSGSKKAVGETEVATAAKAPAETSVLGKRQALGKSLLQLRKSTAQS